MKKLIISLVALLALTGCGHPAAEQPAASSSAASPQLKKSSKRPNTKAGIDDLIGHYWLNTEDPDQVLQITASTGGYFIDVQRYTAAQAGYATASAGVFAASLTLNQDTYTFSGKAQPNATSATWQFKKLSRTRIQQLPAGPVFRRVKNDDLTTIDH